MNDILFKNNNKKAIRNLTIKNLKANFLRTALIIFTITLSMALMSGITLFVLHSHEENKKSLETRQHVIFYELTDAKIAKLKQNPEVSEVMAMKQGNRSEIDDYRIQPMYLDQKKTQMQTLDLIKGAYPLKKQDIAVDELYLKKLGLSNALGQKITIHFYNGDSDTFNVTGITKKGFSNQLFPLYFSKAYAEKGAQLKDVSYMAAVRIKGAENMSKTKFLQVMQEVGKSIGLERQFINENNAFINSLTMDRQEVVITIVIATFIMFVSALVIYSIFYISVSSRTRQFGQLRTLGLTKRQIKQMIRLEALVLFSIGEPIGLIIGQCFALLLKPNGWSMQHIFVMILLLGINYLFIRLSIAKPAKLAASVSPIEAMNVQSMENITFSKKLHRKLTPVGLARIMAKRHQKKARMTLVSLAISGLIFMIGTSLIASFNQLNFSKQGSYNYSEYNLTFSDNAINSSDLGEAGVQQNSPFTNDLLTKITNVKGVNQIYPVEKFYVQFDYKNTKSDDVATPITDKQLKSLYKRNDKSYRPLKEDEVIILNNPAMKEIFGWTFKMGDHVRLRWYNGTNYRSKQFKIVDEFNNAGLQSEKEFSYLNGLFILPKTQVKTFMPKNYNLVSEVNISTDWYDDPTITERLNQLLSSQSKITMSTLEQKIEEDKSTYKIISTTVIGFSLFIIFFSIVSLINMSVTNIVSRRHEYAMLQSIGLTKRQLKQMLWIEGLHIGVKNILFTAVFGGAVGYGLISYMRKTGAMYLNFHYPFSYLLLYTLFMITISFVIPAITVRIISKKSLMEQLKQVSQ